MGHSAKNAAVEHEGAGILGSNSTALPPPRPHRARTAPASVVVIESDPELGLALRLLLVKRGLDPEGRLNLGVIFG